MARISITLGEGLRWLVGKLRDEALGAIPDKEQLGILTERMRGNVNRTRLDYHAALQQVVQIEDPEHPEAGRLPNLRRRLARREEQGTNWGQELASCQDPERKIKLTALLQQCSTECSQIEGEIRTQEKLLETNQETTRMRKGLYDAARADLKRLTELAPSILAQTEALKAAQKERLRAMEASGEGADSEAGALLQQLQADLEEAQAGSTASEIMVEEEADEDLDLDQVAEEEAARMKQDERIARWTAAPAATS